MSNLILPPAYRKRDRAAMLDDIPGSPSSYDDEFNSVNLDAKWTERGNGTTISANAIDPYAALTTEHRRSHNSYRSSWYMAQPNNTNSIDIYQSVSLPSECFVWARLGFAMRYSTNANNDFELGLNLCASSAGAPDYNNRVCNYLNESSAGVAHTFAGKCVAGVFTSSSGQDKIPGSLANSALHQPFCYVGIQKISTTYYFAVGEPGGHWMWLTSQTHASTMAFLTFTFANTDTGAPGNLIMGVDFVRYKAGRFIP